MHYIYTENQISSFLDNTNNSNHPQINDLLVEIRNTLFVNDQLDLTLQSINTENDLKCIIFQQLNQVQLHQNLNFNFEVHSEEADIIKINDVYCNNLTESGDITKQTTRTRNTDITITINPIHTAQTGLNKSYSRFGAMIDIELKYIRAGFNMQYLRDIRRDLCKLKYAVDTTQEHHLPNNPIPHQNYASKYGIFFWFLLKKCG